MKAPFSRSASFSRDVLNRGLRGGMATKVVGMWDWILFPALFSIAATIVLAVSMQLVIKPLSLPVYLPEPIWPMVLAFAWPLIRPSYITPFALALLGLFLDYFWGTPKGLWTLLLMLVYAAMTALRTFMIGQDRLVVFAIYVASELVAFTVGVIFMTLDTGQVPRLVSVAEQMFATTLLFPFVLYLLEKYLHADVRFG